MKQNSENLNSIVRSTERKTFFTRWFSALEPGSVRTASSALAATALGAGALAVPYAFSLTGLGLGLLTLTMAGLISSLSLQVLMIAGRYTGTESYAAVLELAVGSKWASLMLDLVVLMNGIGAIACILIFEGDFLPSVLASPPGLSGVHLSRVGGVIAAAIAVWPLTLMPNISALRFVNVAVPIVLVVTISIVLCDVPTFSARLPAGEDIVWWDFEPKKWLQAAAIMINAFANHQNAIPAVTSMEKPSILRIVKATLHGNLMVLVLYACLGTGGYVSFAGATKGDFLLNYPEGRPEIWACRLMLALIVYLVLPVAAMPTAKSAAQFILSVLGRDTTVGPKTHKVSATVLMLFCATIASLVSDVSSVIGVLGGILASSLMFWFPAVVFKSLLWPTQPHYIRWFVMFCIVFLGVCGWASVAVKFF
jgi:amino acid permease